MPDIKRVVSILVISALLLASCSSITVGGGVSGGSSGDIDVGVGVGIEL